MLQTSLSRVCLCRLIILAAALTLVGGSAYGTQIASAQSPPPTESPHRSGVTGGLGLGFGTLEIGEESHGTLNYALQFGGYITNQWALLIEVWGGTHSDDEFRIDNNNRGVAAQYWMRERPIWFKAMLGASTLETIFEDITFAKFNGVAVGGGGGWMFWERGDYHVDVQFRLTVEGFEDSRDNAVAFALGVGVSYF